MLFLLDVDLIDVYTFPVLFPSLSLCTGGGHLYQLHSNILLHFFLFDFVLTLKTTFFLQYHSFNSAKYKTNLAGVISVMALIHTEISHTMKTITFIFEQIYLYGNPKRFINQCTRACFHSNVYLFLTLSALHGFNLIKPSLVSETRHNIVNVNLGR